MNPHRACIASGLILALAASPALSLAEDYGWWAMSETTPGLYRMELGRNALRVARQEHGPGGVQSAGLSLVLPQPVQGDFETSAAFSNARIEGGLNQIELQASFADGSLFFVVRDREGSGSHVWGPGIQGNIPCGAQGVLSLRRSAGTLSGYCDGQLIHSAERRAPLTSLRIVLQNNGTQDPIAVTFRDWRFQADSTAALPPPGRGPAADRPASSGSLLAAYDLDGDARDASGQQRHGRIDGAVPTADRFGRAGKAMQFNGRAFIELPLDINPEAMPQLTFTAWVRADDASPVRQVMSHDNGGYDRSLGIDTRGGGLGWSLFTGSGVLGHKPVETGRWVFVAGVWDQASGKTRLHVDQSVFERESRAGGGHGKTSLGRNPGFGEHFVGAIDEVRFHARALSREEIAALSQTKASPVPAFLPPPTAPSVNLARGKPASQSSTSQWSKANDAQGAVDGVINGGYSFHTNQESNPWWQVDLGGPARIDEVRLFNRLDCCAERARTVQVLLSDDGRAWHVAYRHNGQVFGGQDGKPLKIQLNGERARYLRLQLNEVNWFHLDEVEVRGRMEPAVTPPPQPARNGNSKVLLESGNIGGTLNGPTQPTRFTLDAPHVISLIEDYHWNNARGAPGGNIALKDAHGRLFGPWPVRTRSGQGGAPSVYWTATPLVTLPAGSYTVVDSDPSTWSHNPQSGGRGFSRVEGYRVDNNRQEEAADTGRDYTSGIPAGAVILRQKPAPEGKDQLEQVKDLMKGLKGLFK